MSVANPIKIAIIGLGRAGYNIHVRRLREDPRFCITACADWIPARLKEMRDEFGCATFKDYETLLKEAEAEVVVVATYNHTHAPITIEVLRSGRHAICEKPMAASYAEAKKMLATAEKKGLKLMIHHNYRFFPETRYLIDIVKNKRLGDVFEIRMRSLHFARRYDWQTLRKFAGGVLNNTCPHFLDIGLQLLEAPVKDIFCDLKQIASFGDVEDHVKVVLRAENGRVYDMEVSSVCKFPEPKWTILGSHGTLISDGTTSKLAYFDPKKAGKYRVLEKPTPDREYVQDEKIPWQEKEEPTRGPDIGDFYDNVYAVLRENKPMIVPPQEALEVVRITEECKKRSGFY